jgi:hypothetical protein
LDKKHDGTLATLVATYSLADPLVCQHSSHSFPTSHIRGSIQIDFILVTQRQLPAVKTSRYMAFHSLFNSDHSHTF